MVKVIFFSVGWLAIAISLAAGSYSYFGLRPRVNELTDHLNRSLQATDQTISAIENNKEILTTTLATIQASGQIAYLFPETLIALKGTLHESSALLNGMGHTAEQASKGAVGLIMPDQSLRRNNDTLKKTALQLDILAEMIDHIRVSSVGLTGNMRTLSSQIKQLQLELGSTTSLLSEIREYIQGLQRAIHNAAIPMHVALFGISLAGQYLLMGLLSFALGLFYGQFQKLNQVPEEDANQQIREKQKVA